MRQSSILNFEDDTNIDLELGEDILDEQYDGLGVIKENKEEYQNEIGQKGKGRVDKGLRDEDNSLKAKMKALSLRNGRIGNHNY
jgi:hypothetical protein